jgi:hypothetical protein
MIKGFMENKRLKVNGPARRSGAELSLWKEGMPPLWHEIAKDKPEVAQALKTVKGSLQR